VQTVRERVPDPGRTMVVALSHRYLASELAFYLPDQPVVYHRPIGPAGGVQSQYDLWPGPESRIGDDALIVQSARHAPLAPEVRACFESVSKVDQLHVPRAHGEYQSLDLYLGRNLLHWPPAPNTVAR
jgi:hypothetical protein